MKITILILTYLFLSGCGGHSHPKMLSFTPASVVIDYSDNDLHEATNMAQQFCASINKDAQYVKNREEGWVSKTRTAFFNCIESSRGHSGGYQGSNNIPIINNYR